MIVRIWEARVTPGRLDEALEWVRRDVAARALKTKGCLAAEILKSEGDTPRALLITRWDEVPRFEEGWLADDVFVDARARHVTPL